MHSGQRPVDDILAWSLSASVLRRLSSFRTRAWVTSRLSAMSTGGATSFGKNASAASSAVTIEQHERRSTEGAGSGTDEFLGRTSSQMRIDVVSLHSLLRQVQAIGWDRPLGSFRLLWHSRMTLCAQAGTELRSLPLLFLSIFVAFSRSPVEAIQSSEYAQSSDYVATEKGGQGEAARSLLGTKLTVGRESISEGLYRDNSGAFARLRLVVREGRLTIEREFLGGSAAEVLWVDGARGRDVAQSASMSVLQTAAGDLVVAVQATAKGKPAVLVWRGLGGSGNVEPALYLAPEGVSIRGINAEHGVLVVGEEAGMENPVLIKRGSAVFLLCEVQVKHRLTEGGKARERTAVVCSEQDMLSLDPDGRDAVKLEVRFVAFGKRASAASRAGECLLLCFGEGSAGDKSEARQFLRLSQDDSWDSVDILLPEELRQAVGEHALFVTPSGYLLLGLVPASGPGSAPPEAEDVNYLATLFTCRLEYASPDSEGVILTELGRTMLLNGKGRAVLCGGLDAKGSVRSYVMTSD